MHFFRRKRTKRLNWKKKVALKRGVSFILAFLLLVFGIDFNGFGVHIHVGGTGEIYASDDPNAYYGIWCSTCGDYVDHFHAVPTGFFNHKRASNDWKDQISLNGSIYIYCKNCNKTLLIIRDEFEESHYSESDTTTYDHLYCVEKFDNTVTFPNMSAEEHSESDENTSSIYQVDVYNNIIGADYYDTYDDFITAANWHKNLTTAMFGLFETERIQNTEYYQTYKAKESDFTWTDWYDAGSVKTANGTVYTGLSTYLSKFGYTASRVGVYVNITTQPVNKTIKETENASFTIAVDSNENYTCQWQVSTDGGTSWTNISNNSIYTGATTSTLSINKAPYSYNGYKYRCVVTGDTLSATSTTALLTVNQGLIIIAQPVNKTVKELADTSLAVTVTSNHTYASQWQVSTNGGTSWTNISNNSIYTGATTNTLSINKAPYSYNGYKYRCVITGARIINSGTATLTVTSGLAFDSQPTDTSGFEKVNLTLTAPSSFAKSYGSFQWQVKNSSGVWENLADGNKAIDGANISYAGTTTDTLVTQGYLTGTGTEQNVKEYRCVISTNIDSLHGQVYSNSAKITIIRNGYKSIIAGYTGTVDVPGTLNIDDIFVSVLYDNGNMVQASGWNNLFFTKDGTKASVYNVTEIGEQTVDVVLVDMQDSSRNLTSSFTVTGEDLSAPEWIEGECITTDYEIVASADEIKPISITLSAEDAYSEKDALRYAFVQYGKILSDGDFSTKKTYNILLDENAKYMAYVKDEAGNMAEKEFYFNVLDDKAPIILSFTENPDKDIAKSALLVVNAKDAVDAEGVEGVGNLSYMFYSTNDNTNLDNELLDTWITGNTVSINQTGTYYVEIKDALGNSVKSSALIVDNLDGQAPEAEISFSRNSAGGIIVVEATDKETLTAVVSGLKTAEDGSLDCFSVVDTEGAPVAFEVSGDSQKATAIIPISNSNNNNYVIRIVDAVGNVTIKEVVAKDTLAPELTVRTELSEDGGSGIFKFVATDNDSVISNASGLKTTQNGSLDCFSVTDGDGNEVELTTQVITEENGLVYSASAAFKTRTTTAYTIQAVDNAGNVTTITQSLSADIVEIISDGVITGVNGVNQLGTSVYPDWTQGSVQLTAYIKDATENYEWSLDYNETATLSDTQEGSAWHLGSYGPYAGSISSYFAFPVSANGTYTIYAKDSNGGIYKTSAVVGNIDKTAPSFDITVDGSLIIINAEDDCSGIDHITINGGSLNTIQQKQCYGAKRTEVYAEVAQNGNYTVTVYDVAGNVAASKNTVVTEADETKYYNVTFNNYDGSIIKAELVEEGKDATPPTVSREGYTFTGWDKSYSNIQEDRSIMAIFVENESNKDITAIGDEIYYNVDFLNYDGAILDSQKVEKGGDATPPTVSREGYTFTGWDKSYSNIQENRSIKALFIKNNTNKDTIYYSVDFLNYDGGIIASQKVEEGKDATPPTVSREGYTFIGWNDSYSNIQNDKRIKALFVENESDKCIYYSVDFLNYDGAILNSQKVEKGGTATPPTVSREGYIFTGWDKSYSNIQEDVQITALFIENETDGKAGTGGSSAGSGTYSTTGTMDGNKEVGKEFEDEEVMAPDKEEALAEEKGNVVMLSEFTDSAMLLGEYQEPDIKEETWHLFEEENIPLDSEKNSITTDEGVEAGGSKWPAILLLGSCGAFAAFYFLNKKYYWIDLPF